MKRHLIDIGICLFTTLLCFVVRSQSDGVWYYVWWGLGMLCCGFAGWTIGDVSNLHREYKKGLEYEDED